MVELAELRGARIIGPNCLGIISPGRVQDGRRRRPGRQHTPGLHEGQHRRDVALRRHDDRDRSTLTAAGLGQSTCVSIGGDAIVGTTYAELMPFFEADPETQAIAIYSEPGGRMEAELAEWVQENESRLPIVAFMAGRFMDEMKGMRFGHAGTIVEGKEDTTAEKIKRMEAAGISVAERIEEIPALIRSDRGRERRTDARDFIDVSVDADIAKDAELAKKLEEVCPVASSPPMPMVYASTREPRRVRALRPLPAKPRPRARVRSSSSTSSIP